MEAKRREAAADRTAMKENRQGRLEKRDFINIGIYTAIYFVIVLAVAMLGMMPVFMALLAVLVPVFGAIPFVMYLAKIRKSGMILITSLILGIMMILTGMGFYTLIVSVITGCIAERIWRGGQYTRIGRIAPTYAVFSLWCWGNYLPWFLARQAYMADRASYGQQYWAVLEALLPIWMLPVLLIVCFVCGLLAGRGAVRVLSKKLRAAGLR